MLNDVAVRGRVGARDVILTGPRGIGKTAALLAFGDICRESHYEVVNLQAAAGNAGLIDSVVGEARERIESEVRREHPAAGVLVTVDEMRVSASDDLALLAAALQRLNADHPQAAVLFAGSGLPHMPEVLRAAGRHASRPAV
jgi:AAA+ superfamily predicted ATPase